MGFIIKAPNDKHTGVTAGVAFANGVGRVEDKARTKWFEDRGYTIAEEEKAAKKPTEKEKLQAEAKELGIEFDDKTTSKELKSLIDAKKADLAEAQGGKE